MKFLELIKYLSIKKFIYHDYSFLELSNVKDKENIEKLLITKNLEFNNIFDLIKFYYINRISIHNILYKNKKNIQLNNDLNQISCYYYLSLLIRDNIDIINYSYSIDYIKKVNDKYKKENKKYTKIIISKIILELIYNYKGLYQYLYNINEIEKIEQDNIKIIKDNINIFKELNINWKEEDIQLKKIDEIYIEIIIALIKQYKIKKYEYISDIIKQLDLESINITKIMFEKIKDFLNNNENLINEYIISTENDIYNNNKINFYYIILKYLLKHSYFIYEINFLFKTRYFFIKIIKSNIIISFLEINKNEKLKVIIEILIGSEYYKQIFDKKLTELSNNSKNEVDKDTNKNKKLNNIINLQNPNYSKTTLPQTEDKQNLSDLTYLNDTRDKNTSISKDITIPPDTNYNIPENNKNKYKVIKYIINMDNHLINTTMKKEKM